MREKINYIFKNPLRIIVYVICKIPYFRFIRDTPNTQTPINFSTWFMQKVLGFNRSVYWPVHFTSKVYNSNNIYAGIETCPGYMPACYIQGEGKIYIGDYTQIGPNVGMISANHDLHDNTKHNRQEVMRIGEYCWIGMNSVILPGVVLGDFTIVAAGSIVTKSFPAGFCVIGGNPAKLIKKLNQDKCVRHKSEFEYNGYIRASKFEKFRTKYLNV